MEHTTPPQSSSSTDTHEKSAYTTSEQTPEKKENPFLEILRFAALALIIVLPIRFFIAQPFFVSGASMEETFHTGDYLIVDQLTYHLEDPKRGDVIVFRYPKDTSKFFIKRIIGLPGDTVNISGRVVTITNKEHPEGVVLNETYVQDMKPTTTLTEELGEGEYFVMGDNRNQSSDSRAWGILPREKIIGRAFVQLLPITNIELFPGKHDIEAESALAK